MNTTRQSLWFVALLLIPACGGDDGGGSTTDPVYCAEPEFVAGLEPDWAPCGCKDFEGPWVSWCEAAGNVCYGTVQLNHAGFTCSPKCESSADCPSFMGIEAVCGAFVCKLPCDDSTPCPVGMYCSLEDYCYHEFRPEETTTS